MITVPAMLDGFPVQPPVGANLSAHPDDALDVTLGIDAAGRYCLNKRPIDAAALPERLRAIYAGDRADRVMYLKADQQLDYAVVLTAVDVARRNGVDVVGMIAEQRGPAGRGRIHH